MGALSTHWRKRIKLGRILQTYPADKPGVKYKDLDSDGKVIRLLNKAYEELSGTTYDKQTFQKEWEEVKKYF